MDGLRVEFTCHEGELNFFEETIVSSGHVQIAWKPDECAPLHCGMLEINMSE